jgi:hypothetical protein
VYYTISETLLAWATRYSDPNIDIAMKLNHVLLVSLGDNSRTINLFSVNGSVVQYIYTALNKLQKYILASEEY